MFLTIMNTLANEIEFSFETERELLIVDRGSGVSVLE